MKKNIQILSAPSILGLRPTGVEKLAESLLSNGLKEKLKSHDSVVVVPTYNDGYNNVRTKDDSILNAEKLEQFSWGLYEELSNVVTLHKFPVVLGGDCSILIGIAAALKSIGTYGILFMDAHADFYLPEQSPTGEAADMDLAIITGRGPDGLANMNNLAPYIREEHVFHLGQRDAEEAKRYGSKDIQDTQINCFDYRLFKNEGVHAIAKKIIDTTSNLKVHGYWLHFDTDVLSDDENPAVDYRLTGGLSFDQCEYLLGTFLKSLPVIGMSITIFNPSLDTKGDISKKITTCIVNAFEMQSDSGVMGI